MAWIHTGWIDFFYILNSHETIMTKYIHKLCILNKWPNNIFFYCQFFIIGELCGLVVEPQTPNQEILGVSPTWGTVLCPGTRHINSPQYW